MCPILTTMGDRDRILADFQTFTGLENIEQCIAILDHHEWNLERSVQETLARVDVDAGESMDYSSFYFAPEDATHRLSERPTDGSHIAAGAAPHGSSSSLESRHQAIQNEDILTRPPISQGVSVTKSSSSADSISAASNSLSGNSAMLSTVRPKEQLKFYVAYKETLIPIMVNDCDRIGKIKELLEKEIGIPVTEQELSGFEERNNVTITDEVQLRNLRLPDDKKLFLLPRAGFNYSANGKSSSPHQINKDYKLIITCHDTGKTYTLTFPGSTTIRDIMGSMCDILKVSVRHQAWNGWPPSAQSNDRLTLAESGLNPVCVLGVRSSLSKRTPTSQDDSTCNEAIAGSRQGSEMIISDDSDDDGHDEASLHLDDDIMFNTEHVSNSKSDPLMPENVGVDPISALKNFSDQFSKRYGELCPAFHQGSLEDAFKAAFHTNSAKDRKLLAIYLHHDKSICSNVYCSQTLCAEAVVHYLMENFITWAWDCTFEANKNRLLPMLGARFGAIAQQKVKSLNDEQHPVLIISGNKSANENFSFLKGHMNVDELMTDLIRTVDLFKVQQRRDIFEEDERISRENEMKEQDRAYRASLEADTAKEKARERDLELRKAQEQKQREEEMRKAAEDEEKEAVRLSLLGSLPEEPPEVCSEPVFIFRVRCPDRTLIRRFYAQNALQSLLDYVRSEGYDLADYKVVTTYPRRDLTTMEKSNSLQSLNLNPQETIVLERN